MSVTLFPIPEVPASPRAAATVVILREVEGGLETFLLKRSGKVGFLPGAHVFPGGRVDPEDADVPVVGGQADRVRMDVSDATAYQVAAVRETFEEAGILLARGVPDEEAREDLQHRRAGFAEIAERLGWVVELDQMVYWSWWVTPAAEPRRYDTRFFVAGVSRDAAASHDCLETVDSAWVRPSEAVVAADEGTLMLAPPTYLTLKELIGFDTIASVLTAGRGRAPTCILPLIGHDADGAISILLPGDELNPSGEPVEGPTRLTLRDGRWLLPPELTADLPEPAV